MCQFNSVIFFVKVKQLSRLMLGIETRIHMNSGVTARISIRGTWQTRIIRVLAHRLGSDCNRNDTRQLSLMPSSKAYSQAADETWVRIFLENRLPDNRYN